MKISLKWLEHFLDLKEVDRQDLLNLIGSRLVEIESVNDISEKYQFAKFVEVVSVDKIIESDHLMLVKIDDRQSTIIDRDENGLIQIVCGANNVRIGMKAVWLPPESIIPATFSTNNQVKLSVRSIKGYNSYGMLASFKELDLSESHDGIIDIKDQVEVGSLIKDYLLLDDLILDIDNKSLTHRPDCFGLVGFAREISGIINKKFESPNWFREQHSLISNTTETVRLQVEGNTTSNFYSAAVINGYNKNNQTPLLIQSLLSRCGIRPINPIVDATNYAMLISAQPLHAYDYDKIVAHAGENPEIIIRQAFDGEELELLDGSSIILSEEDIVISAGDKAIGLAGAMGGKNTAVDENTKSILLESATFDLYKIRSTQMRHGIFTEAITRFTKGQPANLCKPVLDYTCSLIAEWTGAKIASRVATDTFNRESNTKISLNVSNLNDALGTYFETDDVVNVLENIEWNVESNKDSLIVQAPFWRTDVHIVEDIYEEVGRLNGFDNIIPKLPNRSLKPARIDEFDLFRQQIRQCLARVGANEVLTYSFVHESVLRQSSIDIDNSYKIVNAISPELQYYRQSLIPSLLLHIHPNIKAGYDSFSLFEQNKVHAKSFSLDETNVPNEANNLAVVVTSRKTLESGAYFSAIRVLKYLISTMSMQCHIIPTNVENHDILSRPFLPQRSGIIVINGYEVGVVGEFNYQAKTGFKLPECTAGFEINLDKLFGRYDKSTSYRPISKYPGTTRDVSLKVASELPYSRLLELISNSLPINDITITPTVTNIYQDTPTSPTKNVTFRLYFEPYGKTLTANEANVILNQIIGSVGSMISVEVI